MSRAVLALACFLPLLASACRPGDVPMAHKRNLGMGKTFPRRQAAPTDVASAAESIDPQFECSYYNYAPAAALTPHYPTIWETATIGASDTEAQAKFQAVNASLNAKFPNIAPRGTGHMGNWTGLNYPATDPDCWWTWKGCDSPAADTGLKADITTVPEPMTWGFGFDDGPNCSHNALYDYLQEQKQTATMFYIGSNVMDWPLQALRAIQDGHQICVHTWSHQYMTSFSNEEAFAELYYTQKVIKDLLGVTPMCWRPPFGDVDNRIRFIAEQLNLTTIVWSDDTEDWREGVPADNVTPADVTANYQAIVSKAKNGTYNNHGPVVLNHELTNFTMSEMIRQYSSLSSTFKHLVPICAAYNITQPYMESDVICPNFDTYISGTIKVSNTTRLNSGSSSSSSSASGSGSMTTGTASASNAAGATGTQQAAASTSAKTSGAEAIRVLSIGAVLAFTMGVTVLAI